MLVLPQLRGFGVSPRFEVQTSMRSREAWTEPKKKMARWYRRYRRSSYRRTGKHWSPTTQVVNTATSSGSQKSLPSRSTTRGTSGEQLPDRTDHEGEVLSPEYRVRIECDCSLGACLCPDGLPIGRLNVAGSQADSVPGALYEPQQFIIASGVYTSQGSSGASALASLDAPSQESIRATGCFVWQA